MKRRSATRSDGAARSLGPLIALGALALAGCSTTLTEDDCARYRDRLVGWAQAKGADRKGEAEAFMRSCPGTTIARSTKKCMEGAGDQEAFLRCLE